MSEKYKSIIDIDIDDTSEDVSFDILEESSLSDITENNHAVKQFDPLEQPDDTGAMDLKRLKGCPRCGKPLVNAICINESESESFKECPECGTLVNTFKPISYQEVFLKRPERYKMTAGGFGSGKSRVDIEDVIKHVLLVPKARVAITARTYAILEATFIKDFYSKFPKKLVIMKNESKHELRLSNGSEILFRSFDDPKKLKSLNLTMAVIVEGSDVLEAGFHMLQSRIRNTAAMIPEYHPDGTPIEYFDEKSKEYKIKYRIDIRHINIETNPDSGWVKDFLLDSKVRHFFGDSHNEGYRFKEDADKDKYSQVISTSANPYLPETYEEEQTRGKSKAYVQQFYKGSFNFSSNLVFPNFGTCIVKPHKLPRTFDELGRRRLFYAIGLDYGINDPTHVIFSAYSKDTHKLYVFGELRIDNSDVKTIAREYRKTYKQLGINMEGLFMLPRFDGRSYNKRESDLHTIGGMFEAEGLYFEPSFAKHEPRILKLNALINHAQIEIYSTCEFLIEEALNYKFKLDRNGAPTKKPKDGKDHGITALEFVVVELPHNLTEIELSAYLPQGGEFVHDKRTTVEKKKIPVWDPLKKEDNNVRGNANVLNNLANHRSFSGGRHFSTTHIKADSSGDKSHDTENFGGQLKAYIPGH